MFFKILKKDIKRSKTMNTILFLFIVLATVFVSSGMNNLVSVMNGMNYFVDLATGEKADYFLMVDTGKDDSKTRKVLDDSSAVKSYGVDRFFNYTEYVKDENGKKLEWNGLVMIESPETTYLHLYDSEDKEINQVDKGHIYLSKKFMNKFDVKTGDKIYLKFGTDDIEYIVDGPLKDAFLGSEVTGGYRFFMNKADADVFMESEEAEHMLTESFYIETDDVEAVSDITADIEGSEGGYSRSVLILTRIVEMVVAFVIVILSICLIIVSFVILKFSIGMTIQDDFREIGVMKAIGIRNFKIRTLYLVKYTAMAIIGAVIGLMISYPFGDMLMKSVTENMVLGNSYGKMINIYGAIGVFAVIMLLAYFATRKVKKLSPVDAIRSGETGERFKKKRGLRISRSHSKNSSYLSWNDIVSSPKRYLNIIFSFALCTLFLLVLANFSATADSSAFAGTLAHRSDLYLDNEDPWAVDMQSLMDKYPEEIGASDIRNKDHASVSYFAQFEHGKEIYVDYMKLIEQKLAEEGMPAKVFNDIIFSYNFNYEGKDYNYSFSQVVGERYGEYEMTEGSAPQNKNEVAITNAVREQFGIDIGDTIEVDFDGTKLKCTVTGVFQSMNNLGNMIRVYDDVPTSLAHYSGCINNQIAFTDNPSDEEIQNRKERIKEIFGTEKVEDAKEFCVTNMGAADAMKAVELLLVVITVIVVILVTVMMERSFIAKETKQIAILKAMGFRDKEVIRWHVKRFGILATVAVVIAMATSIPVTNLAGGALFGMMGASKVPWIHNFASLVRYPLVVIAVTLLISWITALYTGKVKARDTASIE